MEKQQFGMIGLGVMGQNFALNVERNGYRVAVFDINREAIQKYMAGKAKGKKIRPAYSLEEFVSLLARPRHIMLLVPAGKPVDAVIGRLLPLLEAGDLIIDGGNSYFKESERRERELREKGIRFLGMGVSGGEEGALWGPSLMPGGSREAYREVEELLVAVSAKASEDGRPCVTYIGPGGSGHFVKMVHNGIEYADMELISEAYFLLKKLLDLSAEEFYQIFSEWNRGELSSFLIEIAAKVFQKIDRDTGLPLIDLILDKAGQKGTGKWTSQIALDLGTAVPTITAAVDARVISSQKGERMQAEKLLAGPVARYNGSPRELIDAVRDALYASKICSYAQGMSLLKSASLAYDYQLDLSEIARIWRAGCIIRAKLLNPISAAFRQTLDLPNLLLADEFRRAVQSRQPAWRSVIATAVNAGIPVPAMGASLAYYDAYRSGRLPANLIQALRDFFGAHTFERTDKPGTFHADWEK